MRRYTRSTQGVPTPDPEVFDTTAEARAEWRDREAEYDRQILDQPGRGEW